MQLYSIFQNRFLQIVFVGIVAIFFLNPDKSKKEREIEYVVFTEYQTQSLSHDDLSQPKTYYVNITGEEKEVYV